MGLKLDYAGCVALLNNASLLVLPNYYIICWDNINGILCCKITLKQVRDR